LNYTETRFHVHRGTKSVLQNEEIHRYTITTFWSETKWLKWGTTDQICRDAECFL